MIHMTRLHWYMQPHIYCTCNLTFIAHYWIFGAHDLLYQDISPCIYCTMHILNHGTHDLTPLICTTSHLLSIIYILSIIHWYICWTPLSIYWALLNLARCCRTASSLSGLSRIWAARGGGSLSRSSWIEFISLRGLSAYLCSSCRRMLSAKSRRKIIICTYSRYVRNVIYM